MTTYREDARMDPTRALFQSLAAETAARSARLAELGIGRFVAGDPRHGLPAITVMVEEAATVMADNTTRAAIEHVAREGRKNGVFLSVANAGRVRA
ncbi:hypothetical protein ACFY4C_20990 [Actinomadura viridis]|uniref:hypothetical protein n=1 Tax=Actinomadura viridis TaxID=58110 RepID=UPI0036A0EC18